MKLLRDAVTGQARFPPGSGSIRRRVRWSGLVSVVNGGNFQLCWVDWLHLLAVVAWIEQHPRPGIYLWQVDLSGVHSKFIETHRAVPAELLDWALPADHIEAT